MAFPNNPSPGTTHGISGRVWSFNGYGWDRFDLSSTITNYVESVNGITGIVGISAGSLINITQSGKTLIISSPDSLYGVSGSIYASNLATGLLHGGIITINAGNSAAFDITAGRGQIHLAGGSFTADPLPTLQYINWTAKTGVTLSGLASSDTTWLYFDNTGTLQQQSTYYTDDQIDQNIIVGALVHPSRSYISLAKTIPNVGYATDKQYEQFIRIFGPLKQSGHTISANGANLKLNRSSGSAYILGRNWINDPNNPTVVTDNAQTDCTFWRYYRGATAGTFVTVLNQTAIDPNNYDNGSGTLQPVPSNKQYTIQRLFYFPGTPTVLGVYYGRDIYASMPDAAANIQFENFTEIDNTKTNAILAGFLIVKKDTTNLTTAIAADECRIIQSGIFRSTVSGGGSIATKLDDLTDVTISGIVADHNTLIYDIVSSQWKNTEISHIAVSRFNGRTGDVQGVSAASAGSGISVSGATGAVTITNTGVLSFNGSTGAVFGVSSINGQTGAITGISAAQVVVGSSNVNATRYLTFVGGSGSTGISIDDVTTPLSYNPQQGNIGAKKVTLTTSSNVITIDSTTPVFTLTDGANISTFGLYSFSSTNGIPFELSASVGLTLASGFGGIAMSGSGYYYKFPESNGTNGHILTTNGSGSLSWGTTVAGISASAGICGGAHVRSEGGYRLGTSSLNARTGTTYTLLSTDDGKIITSANAATQTITIPSGLPVGFNCTIIQLGTGGVGITSGFSATLASYQNKFNIVGQYAAATVVSYSSDIFVLVGGLTG